MKTKVILLTLFITVIVTACNRSSANQENSAIKKISVEQAQQATDGKNTQFIDVRTEAEYRSGHALNAVNLPLDSLAQNLAKLDKTKPVYVICQTGRRSQKGAEILQQNGFTDLYNIEGGTSAWEKAGFPVEK